MSATNATTYYELPVFIATDKPAWLTDWNGAMNAIDTAIKEALTAGENAQTTANTATTSIATINDSLTTINTSLSTLTSTTTGLVGSVNTINSLIGNGEPTTSDKTLIGAINEIYGMITGGGGGNEIQAGNVVYDNTTSGLTADDVQEAIDEVVGMISGGGGGADLDFTAHAGTPTVTPVSGGTVDTNSTFVEYGLNSDKSLGKINGSLRLGGTIALTPQDWNVIATISSADFPTRTADVAVDLGFCLLFAVGDSKYGYEAGRLVFKQSGDIEVQMHSRDSSSYNINEAWFSLPPCIYSL